MVDLCWEVLVLNFTATPTILTQIFMDFQSASKQGLLNFLKVQATSAKYGLHADNMKFNTQYKE